MLTDYILGALAGTIGIIDCVLFIRSRCGQRFSFWQKMIPLSGFYAYWLDLRDRHELTRISEMDSAIRKAQEK